MCGAGPAPARVAGRHLPARVPAALEWPAARDRADAQPPQLNRRRDALAARVASGKALPPEILKQIVTRTDGVPLFVEELTKTVLESGLLREEDSRYVLDGPVPPLAIPTSLHASLMARLDRLAPSVREVAQTGAAIGREFSYELLAAVGPLPEEPLRPPLEQLVTAELVFARGTPPDATYHVQARPGAGCRLRDPASEQAPAASCPHR